MKNLLIIFLFSSWWGTTQAQYWEALYGNENNQKLYCGIKAVNILKGHAMTGHHNAGLYSQVYVVRTNDRGFVPASTSPFFNRAITIFLAPTFDKLSAVGKSIVEMKNTSGHALAGMVQGDVFFMTVDNTGMPVTQMAYTANKGTQVFSIAESTIPNASGDHDYYITGSILNTTSDVFVIKVDKNGTIIWQRVIDLGVSNSRDDIAYDIIENPHNTTEVCLVGSTQEIAGATPISSFLINLNSINGTTNNVIWFSNNSSQIILRSINEAYNPGNGFILGGTCALTDEDFLLINYDLLGATINWVNHYDYSFFPGSNNECMDVKEHLDLATNVYRYYATGVVKENGARGGQDIMVIITDNNGNGLLNGEVTYGGSNPDNSVSISVDSDYPKLTVGIYGTSESYAGFGFSDFYLIKPDMNGGGVCNNAFENSVSQFFGVISSSLSDHLSTPFTAYNIYAEGEDLSYGIICKDGKRLPLEGNAAEINTGRLEHPTEKSSFSVYPNPTNGIVTIKLNSNIGPCQYEVVDMKGGVIDFGTIAQSHTMDLSAQPRGLYLLKIISSNGTIELQKLILD
ncbi:MAG TPA: T9SS type A sorting domain-containing protein [Bacteroidia bacterium]|nr:T9SS type A sorting domain-containing protein [Bacteroidia bacterium]